MEEPTALSMIYDIVDLSGDDAAVIDGHVLSIDMLHERTDFPAGVTRYTAGWRSVGASLSDIAAMGARPIATVAAYGAPRFDESELEAFIRGATEVSAIAGARYVGGDLDTHDEFTVATTALGTTESPVLRSGASVGDRVCVTGEFGRSAAAIDCFTEGDVARGNDLFRFSPRVEVGQAISSDASSMIDSSDGLARSLHQLATASECGFTIDGSAIPVHHEIDQDDERAWYFGEDFELVFTAPANAELNYDGDVPITEIGQVTDGDVTVDGRPLPDRGYQHG